VSVREAAFVLGLSEPQVRYRLRTRRLGWAVRRSRVDAESVRRAFPADATRDLRERVLSLLLAGRLEAPRLGSRYERFSFDQLCAAAVGSVLSAVRYECRVRYRVGNVRRRRQYQ
jgi:hypothetical protein